MEYLEKLEHFKTTLTEYQQERKKILSDSEKVASDLAESYNTSSLYQEIKHELDKKIDEAITLYSKIYNDDPSLYDFELFIKLATEIIASEDFITSGDTGYWETIKALVEALYVKVKGEG